MSHVSRRSFFGLAAGAASVAAVPAAVLSAVTPSATIAAPAVAAEGTGALLTLAMITKETVSLWKRQNQFLAGLDMYEDCF